MSLVCRNTRALALGARFDSALRQKFAYDPLGAAVPQPMLKHYLELPREVYFLCLGMFLHRCGTVFMPFLTLYFTRELHTSIELATLSMTCFGFGAVCGGIVGGHLADRFGRKLTMLTALLGGALVLVALGSIRSVPLVMATIALYAFVADLFRPAVQAMIADLTEPAKRPYAFGLNYMAINLGFGVGPALGEWLIARSFSYLFYATACSTLVFFVFVLTLLPETLRSRVQASERAADSESTGFLAALGFIARDRIFLAFCVGTFLISLVYLQGLSTFPIYLQSLPGEPRPYGHIILVNGLIIAFTQIFVTAAVVRFDRFRVLAVASFVTAIGFGLFGLCDTTWQFMLSVAVWTIGEMMQTPMLAPIISEIAPPELRARYMGVLSIAFTGANAFGAPLGGLLLQHAGGRTLWTSAFFVALLGGVCYWACRIPMRARMTPRAVVSATP
jgi:MFS family permease